VEEKMHAARIVINGTFNREKKLGDDPEVFETIVKDALRRHTPAFKGEVEVEDVVNLDKLECNDCTDGVAVKFFKNEEGYSYGVCRACAKAETGERFKFMKSISKRTYLLWLIKFREELRRKELVEGIQSRAKRAFRRLVLDLTPRSLVTRFEDLMMERVP
jgi:hypothetical protein